MLSSDYLFTLTDEISNMYEELNTSIINDIARRIAKMDYASESSIFQAERAIETGALYDDIVKKISIQTGKSQEELKRLFKEAGFRNYENNLRKHSMPYKNIKLSEKAKNILVAGINKTGGVLHNMTMTTANEAQNDFIHITDLAYNQIVNGVMDYNTAIRYAVKDLANKGLKVVDYKTGYKQRIDSAVRTCVLTGVNQTTGPMTELQRQEVGADGYETTAHSGARPEHALWQGKQFYADKPVKGYEDFKTATGYETVTGLKGANCRHDFFWVFLGEDEPSYTKSEIKALNNKSVKYNGKEMTISEAETTMRYIERKTREWKRQANALRAAGLDNAFEKMKAREWAEKYKDFANKTGIPKRNERLVVYDKQNMTNSNNSSIIEEKKEILKKLKDSKIEYNLVQKLDKTLTDDEIIQKISGGDMTKGSCSSLGFAYIANKNGLDVLDFRGGASQDFFSRLGNIYNISQLPGVKSIVDENYNDIMGTMNLLKAMQEGKEYYLSTGDHSAIVRLFENKYQYLELQSSKENGFKPLTTNILKNRFRCKQTHSVQGIKYKTKNILMEVDSFKDNSEFKEILGYINTPVNKQLKGANGNAK